MNENLTVVELQEVLNKIRQTEALLAPDYNYIVSGSENTSYSCNSSEIANLVNQLWMLLQHSPSDYYWSTVGTLCDMGYVNTRTMVLSSMARRIDQ